MMKAFRLASLLMLVALVWNFQQQQQHPYRGLGGGGVAQALAPRWTASRRTTTIRSRARPTTTESCLILRASVSSSRTLNVTSEEVAGLGTSSFVQRASSVSAASAAIAATTTTTATFNTDIAAAAVESGPLSPLSNEDLSALFSSSKSFNSSTAIVDTSSSTSALTPEQVYQRGLVTIAGITLLFASNSPALHAAYSQVTICAPPVILLNAVCSLVALVGMLVAGNVLDRFVAKPPLLQTNDVPIPKMVTQQTTTQSPLALLVGPDNLTLQAGMELGLWKFLGTLANLYGLSLTSASHGAFLIQLTTLFVPCAQGVMGVPIPQRIWTAIGLALVGVAMFTQDGGSGTTSGSDVVSSLSSTALIGDLACIAAAVMYATYDLRLFYWGKLVDPLQMITTKIVTQTALSVVLLLTVAAGPSLDYFYTASAHDLQLAAGVALWSGLAVNAVAPYLQVGGQQAMGPARAQILYASQPLWASAMSFVLLGETVGQVGLMGGAAFLMAMMLAATAELPDANCKQEVCEL